LIWVWVDLRLDEELPVSNATVTVVNSNPKIWVTFDNELSFSIDEMVVKGPLRKISELSNILEQDQGLNFDFEPAKEKMNEAGSYSPPLLPFLQKHKKIDDLNLKVESCKPEILPVKVVGLVSRTLDVKCVDEEQNPIANATIDSPQLDMPVPEDWGADKHIAEVLLKPREIDHARISPLKKIPYIKLAAGQTREAPIPVSITMPSEPDRLTGTKITAATIGFVFSQNLVGKFDVELFNQPDMTTVSIKATDAAKNKYAQQPYHMLLYIRDEDKNATEELNRDVIYNFPEDSVRKGDIELNQTPVKARFKLIPISSTETPKPS